MNFIMIKWSSKNKYENCFKYIIYSAIFMYVNINLKNIYM